MSGMGPAAETRREIAMAQSTARTIQEIARRVLAIESLETQRSDALDFHDIAVWKLREALEAAYEAGRRHGRSGQVRKKA
jgi:hypothetical protein